jgi:hypothetical protein
LLENNFFKNKYDIFNYLKGEDLGLMLEPEWMRNALELSRAGEAQVQPRRTLKHTLKNPTLTIEIYNWRA